jgi:hypothetical protein
LSATALVTGAPRNGHLLWHGAAHYDRGTYVARYEDLIDGKDQVLPCYRTLDELQRQLGAG